MTNKNLLYIKKKTFISSMCQNADSKALDPEWCWPRTQAAHIWESLPINVLTEMTLWTLVQFTNLPFQFNINENYLGHRLL